MTTLSARALFYLENRDLIEAWAALKIVVAQDADRFYREVAQSIADASSELPGGDVEVDFIADDGYVSLFLPHWRMEEMEYPAVSVYMDWDARWVDFKGHVHSGIWIDEESDEDFQDRLQAALKVSGMTNDLRRKGKNDLWRLEVPDDPEAWKNLDALAKTIRESVFDLWKANWKAIDEFIASE